MMIDLELNVAVLTIEFLVLFILLIFIEMWTDVYDQ